MGKVLGIDLGTTNSVVSFLEGKNPEIILTPEGSRLLPSIVTFMPGGERLVGQPAKSQMITNPLHTVFSVKRLIGMKYSEIEPYLADFPYEIVRHGDDYLRIRIDSNLFSPEEISALILAKLKEAASKHLNEEPEGVIITVPAYFNDSQRQATKDAGTIAGLNVLRIINEPTAASLAFSMDMKQKANLVVYDFGGGTIDISVLEIRDGVIKVLSTLGNTQLGGSNFDILLTQKLVAEFKEEYGVDLASDKAALQRIREATEAAKIELSEVDGCEINLPFIAESNAGPLHLVRRLYRSEFENLIYRDVDETLTICDQALRATRYGIADIDEVLLVGGSTRIPLVQKRVREYFKKDPNRRVNPDEIVAMGAALQGGIIKGDSRDILLLDVTPLSLGVKTFGGAFTRIIAANTTIPVSRSLVFSTAEDDQTEVEIMAYQGEREIAEENKLLGQFTLVNIHPAPRGTPRVEVTFNININGILKVSAEDLSTHNQKEILITRTGLLNESEVERLKKEAQRYRDQDQRKRRIIGKKNQLLNHVFTLTRMLESGSLTGSLRNDSQSLVMKARVIADSEDIGEMEKAEQEFIDLEIRLETPVKADVATEAPKPPPPQPPSGQVIIDPRTSLEVTPADDDAPPI